MKKNRLFFILLLLTIQCKTGKQAFDAEKLSSPVRELVATVEKNGFIGTEQIGRPGETSEAYQTRMALLEAATDTELIILTEHPDGEVAATAFQGLVNRDYNELKEVLLDFTKGERSLNYIQGDMFMEMSLLEFAYLYVLEYDLDDSTSTGGTKIEIGLSAEEKAFIRNRILALRQPQ